MTRVGLSVGWQVIDKPCKSCTYTLALDCSLAQLLRVLSYEVLVLVCTALGKDGGYSLEHDLNV